MALESSEHLKLPGWREHFSIFVGVCPPKLGFGGQKLYHRITRPRFAIVPWNHLNIPNRLAAVSVSLFSWRSAPKIGVWGHLGGQEWYHRIARLWCLWFAKTHLRSSEYLKPNGSREHFSVFVGVYPQNWDLGALRGQKLYRRIARPRFAKTLQRSSEYLKLFSSYSTWSLHDRQTDTHTHTHTRQRSINAIFR